MFDIKNNNYTNNIFCKSHPKSVICKEFYDTNLLDQRKQRESFTVNSREVVVLQVMPLNEDYLLIEYLPKNIYDEEFKRIVQRNETL